MPTAPSGFAWTDDARAISLDGQGFAQGDGQLHVALEGSAAQAVSPALPRLSARIVGPPPRHAGEPLRLRVRCRHAACDVRATAEAWGKVPTPPFQRGIGRAQWDSLALAATRTIPAGRAALLEIPTIADYQLTGGARSARHLVRLLSGAAMGATRGHPHTERQRGLRHPLATLAPLTTRQRRDAGVDPGAPLASHAAASSTSGAGVLATDPISWPKPTGNRRKPSASRTAHNGHQRSETGCKRADSSRTRHR